MIAIAAENLHRDDTVSSFELNAAAMKIISRIIDKSVPPRYKNIGSEESRSIIAQTPKPIIEN